MRFRTALLASILCLAVVGPAYASDAPPGCPKTLFCGCALSVKIYGSIKEGLNLAANWLKFSRAEAAPGMVAYGKRRGGGHVFQLISLVKGTTWLVYDPNSGGNKTRIHERSIAGRTIVNPLGGKVMIALSKQHAKRHSRKMRTASRLNYRHRVGEVTKLNRMMVTQNN